MLILHVLAAGAPVSGGSSIATYGPVLAGVASLAAVIVSLLGRKDKQKADVASLQDASTNTAIKGLTEAYDRINAERKDEAERADRAEALYHDREVALKHLESENELLRARNDELMRVIEKHGEAHAPRKRVPAKKVVKKAATRRTRG